MVRLEADNGFCSEPWRVSKGDGITSLDVQRLFLNKSNAEGSRVLLSEMVVVSEQKHQIL